MRPMLSFYNESHALSYTTLFYSSLYAISLLLRSATAHTSSVIVELLCSERCMRSMIVDAVGRGELFYFVYVCLCRYLFFFCFFLWTFFIDILNLYVWRNFDTFLLRPFYLTRTRICVSVYFFFYYFRHSRRPTFRHHSELKFGTQVHVAWQLNLSKFEPEISTENPENQENYLKIWYQFD